MPTRKPRRRVRLLVPRSDAAVSRPGGDGAPFGGRQAHSGPEELVAFGYYDLAALKGVDPASVRRAASRGLLQLNDLLSVARYLYGRQLCRCCLRPILPREQKPDQEPDAEPGPPAPWSHPPTETEQCCPLCWDFEERAFVCGRVGCGCSCHR